MKIIKFIAKNFSGIYSGTGKTKIELDFNNNSNNIILLLGNNGSGKTSLLSILHPFRETYDSRKNFILEGKEGYKEIHIQDKNDLYIVKHYYSKSSTKNKAYITKNGVELNENGGITTFMEIMKERFNLTKEYFTVGKIGSNVQGFIGKSTAERKTYINQFIPNIDEYLDAFEIVNEKYKTYNKDIKSLKASIEKIDENALVIRKSDLETELKALISDNTSLDRRITLLNKEIEDYSEKTKDIDPNIKDIVDEYYSKAEKSDKTLEAYIAKYPALKNYDIDLIEEKLSSNNDKIKELESEIKQLENELTLLNEKDEELKNSISKNENMVSILRTNFVYPNEIKKDLMNKKLELNNNKNKNTIAEQYLKDINEELLILNTPPVDIKYEIDNFFNNINNIKSLYPLNIVESVKALDKDVEYSSILKNLDDENTLLELNLEEVKKKIYYINTNSNKYKNTLSLKPNDCVSSSCSFIKDATYFMNNEYPKLSQYENEEQEYENKIKSNNDKIKEFKLRLDYIKDVKKYLIKNFDDLVFINKIVSINDIIDIFNSTNITQDRIFEIYNNVTTLFNSSKAIEDLTNEIDRTEKVLDESIEREQLINATLAECENLYTERQSLQSRVVSIETSKKDKISAHMVCSNSNKLYIVIKNLINDSNLNWNSYYENKKIFDENKQMLDGIENDKIEVDKLSSKINDNENMITKKTNEIDIIKNKLFLFKTYSDKLSQIENEIQNIELIKDALDPKKGIPLTFMNNYLSIISATANELLDKAYNGDFKIAFKVTSREFMINVFKSDGTMLNDISEASQGEISLTTIALSLSMMKNLLKDCKYNILYLDEVDATLSTSNRRIFLDLLKVQLQNIEQCFVISHNDEFYSQPIDLILMKNNNLNQEDKELMDNKNIIFDINRIKEAS